jgi:predicted amidohydrolase YtcJ
MRRAEWSGPIAGRWGGQSGWLGLLLILATVVGGCRGRGEADLVLLDGKVWTGAKAQPEVEAVATWGGQIVAVGSSSEIRPWIGPQTKVLDLAGRRVLPGFNDAHVHFFDGGQGLASVQLRDAESPAVFRERIANFAATQPEGRWILNGNWDHENWRPAELPTRHWIDATTSRHPVLINRLDGHMALANTLALQLAGITRRTPDPPGGAIERDAQGEPTGLLKDAAMSLVAKMIPDPSEEEVLIALRAALAHAARYGVTSLHDMSASPAVLAAYQQLLAQGQLTARIYAHQPLSQWERLAQVGLQAPFGGDHLRLGGLKGFADGSLGSTTALFFTPYLDAPTTSGLPSEEMIPTSRMLANLRGADRAGLQIAVHAIGDRANRQILDLYAQVAEEHGERDRRFRIEHAQHLRPEEIALFARQRVIASMQPYHVIDDGRWAENRIGPERARGTYAFRSLLDAGVPLAFGSDWFVAPLEPLLGIYAAVTRRTLDGRNPEGWIPEQKITVAEALRAYTYGSAYASFEEHRKGTLEVGKLADLVILPEDPLTIDPERLRTLPIDFTIMGGRVVYQRPQ